MASNHGAESSVVLFNINSINRKLSELVASLTAFLLPRVANFVLLKTFSTEVIS